MKSSRIAIYGVAGAAHRRPYTCALLIRGGPTTRDVYLGKYRTIRRHIWRCLFRHLLLADFSIYLRGSADPFSLKTVHRTVFRALEPSKPSKSAIASVEKFTGAISCAGSARESASRAREVRANPLLVRGKRARIRFSCAGSARESAPPLRQIQI